METNKKMRAGERPLAGLAEFPLFLQRGRAVRLAAATAAAEKEAGATTAENDAIVLTGAP